MFEVKVKLVERAATLERALARAKGIQARYGYGVAIYRDSTLGEYPYALVRTELETR